MLVDTYMNLRLIKHWIHDCRVYFGFNDSNILRYITVGRSPITKKWLDLQSRKQNSAETISENALHSKIVMINFKDCD